MLLSEFLTFFVRFRQFKVHLNKKIKIQMAKDILLVLYTCVCPY